jgi:hypothetical protein
MVSQGSLPARGFIRQEAIDLAEFLQTRNGRFYSGGAQGGAPSMC